MPTHSKIPPLLPHTIYLSSPYNHQDFLCKSPKFPLNLYLNSILEDHPRQFNPKAKEQRTLLKIFRSLKCIKKVHQNGLVFHRMRLPVSKIKDLAKKAQRVEALDLQDRLTSIKVSPVRLDLWLKYGKGLKSVNYQFFIQMFGIQISIPLFERQIQQSLKFLPKHRRLTTFKIRLPHSSSKTVESLFEFQGYPSSLRTFAVYQQKAADPQVLNIERIVTTFSRLKSLESLTLSGPNLLKMTEVLLEKVPSLLNIKKLNVQHVDISTFGPMFDLNHCKIFQKLQNLKIGNIIETNDLAKLTNPPQLESLDVKAAVGLSGLETMSQFLSLFNKSLKSLKLDIQHSYQAETEAKMKVLFNKISELEMLTSFKFRVNRSAPSFAFQEASISPEIIENLKGLFIKPVKLKSFEWEIPRISGPGILLDLLKLLEGSCGTLRKLKIFHPFMDLEKYQEVWTFNFLRKLEKIEVLYLTGFDIKAEHFWMDLVDSLLRMKVLRSLWIGIVTLGFKEEWFIKELGEIMQKRGMEILKIDSSFRAGLGEVRAPLYLKEIMKANPSLKEISNNIRQLLSTIGFE